MKSNAPAPPQPSEAELGPLAHVRGLVAVELMPVTGLTREQLVAVIDFPSKADQCDFQLAVPKLNMFRQQGYVLPDKPPALAAKWAAAVQPSAVVSSARVDGTYVNIFVQPTLLTGTVLASVLTARDTYGNFTFGAGKKILCEYSSPNIAKPFHAGHLRSTVIGSFLSKLHRAMGYEVYQENYLGDWGKQYGLLAIGYQRWGDKQLLKEQPIKHLFDIYVRVNRWARIQAPPKAAPAGDAIKDAEAEKPSEPKKEKCPFSDFEGDEDALRKHLQANFPAEAAYDVHEEARKYFKRMEDGDEEALALWRDMREMSIVEYKKIYERLCVEFDFYGGESLQSQRMVTALAALEAKNLLQSPPEAKGAKVVDLSKHKLPNVVVVKKDGATLYITRDIAVAKHRWDEHHFERMFYVVAAQQDLHFQQLFATLEEMGYEWAPRLTHINFGMVRGMKTRTGEVVFLTDILDEAKTVMLEQMKASTRSKFEEIENPEEVADAVGLSAVIVQDLSAKRVRDYAFEWKRITNFEGDTGPYLQYNHARLANMEVLVKQERGWDAATLMPADFDVALLTEPQARLLVLQVGRFPLVMHNAFLSLEACTIVTYMFDLCHTVSSAHHVLNVIKADEASGKARLALFHAARLVVAKGLRLLGLKPLMKM